MGTDSNDKGKEQLMDELAQLRQEIGEIADRLNNTLTGVLGNIGLAEIYVGKEKPKNIILEKLANAERAFPDIKNLTERLLTLSNQ